MRTGYSIEPQKEGIGENAKTVLCKKIGMVIGKDGKSGAKTMFPLKSAVYNKATGKYNPLPCLRVKLTNGAEDHYFNVMWSNYNETKGPEGGGKFKLVAVELGKPMMLFVKDLMHGRAMMHRMNKQIDYVGMSIEYGSTFELGEWTWGPNQPFEEKRSDVWESANLESAVLQLSDDFGDAVACEVMEQIIAHSEYQRFVDAKELAVHSRYAAA